MKRTCQWVTGENFSAEVFFGCSPKMMKRRIVHKLRDFKNI